MSIEKQNDIELGDPGSLELARVQTALNAVRQAEVELEAASEDQKGVWETRVKLRREELKRIMHENFPDQMAA